MMAKGHSPAGVSRAGRLRSGIDTCRRRLSACSIATGASAAGPSASWVSPLNLHERPIGGVQLVLRPAPAFVTSITWRPPGFAVSSRGGDRARSLRPVPSASASNENRGAAGCAHRIASHGVNHVDFVELQARRDEAPAIRCDLEGMCLPSPDLMMPEVDQRAVARDELSGNSRFGSSTPRSPGRSAVRKAM